MKYLICCNRVGVPKEINVDGAIYKDTSSKKCNCEFGFYLVDRRKAFYLKSVADKDVNETGIYILTYPQCNHKNHTLDAQIPILQGTVDITSGFDIDTNDDTDSLTIIHDHQFGETFWKQVQIYYYCHLSCTQAYNIMLAYKDYRNFINFYNIVKCSLYNKVKKKIASNNSDSAAFLQELKILQQKSAYNSCIIEYCYNTSNNNSLECCFFAFGNMKDRLQALKISEVNIIIVTVIKITLYMYCTIYIIYIYIYIV